MWRWIRVFFSSQTNFARKGELDPPRESRMFSPQWLPRLSQAVLRWEQVTHPAIREYLRFSPIKDTPPPAPLRSEGHSDDSPRPPPPQDYRGLLRCPCYPRTCPGGLRHSIEPVRKSLLESIATRALFLIRLLSHKTTAEISYSKELRLFLKITVYILSSFLKYLLEIDKQPLPGREPE